MRERFAAGLVVDIKAPELATRLAILRMRVGHDGMVIADDTSLGIIAERIKGNVNALKGALTRVVALSSLTGRAITADLTREVLDGLYPQTSAASQSSIGEIQAAVCNYFGLSSEELISSARTPRIAWPRQIAMYLTRELTDESLVAIGYHFGGRDHATVRRAWRRTSARMAADDRARETVDTLRQIIASSGAE